MGLFVSVCPTCLHEINWFLKPPANYICPKCTTSVSPEAIMQSFRNNEWRIAYDSHALARSAKFLPDYDIATYDLETPLNEMMHKENFIPLLNQYDICPDGKLINAYFSIRPLLNQPDNPDVKFIHDQLNAVHRTFTRYIDRVQNAYQCMIIFDSNGNIDLSEYALRNEMKFSHKTYHDIYEQSPKCVHKFVELGLMKGEYFSIPELCGLVDVMAQKAVDERTSVDMQTVKAVGDICKIVIDASHEQAMAVRDEFFMYCKNVVRQSSAP